MALTTYCSNDLSNGIAYSCQSIPVKGFMPNGVIINRDDIDYSTFTMATGKQNTVSNFPLKSNKFGYVVQQPDVDPYQGSQVTMEHGTYMNTFTKEVHLLVVAPADIVADVLVDQLARGEFVVILRKKAPLGDIEYIIYGLDGGLKATEITQEYYNDDTKGAVAVTLTEEGAPSFARFLDAGSDSATETLMATLITNPNP